VARIFISHSSLNNDRAIQLRDWLVANGWDDIFLDLDPERGIAAGERWKEALQKAAQRCEVVLVLLSPEWLASDWCRPELNTAQLLGKKIIVLLIGSKSSEVPSDLKDAQYVDLINDPDAYTRLKEGLKRAGLDPASFPFAEGRRPYPGFAPLEEEDAAIFFGRDGQIVRGLDKLRGLARAGVESMLIILGASGSGKSSFLRAGLWPRLQRDDRTWLPLPTIRPERAAISGKFGLVEALHRIMNEAPFAEKLQKQDLPHSRADIEEFVTTRDDGLLKILAAFREAGHMPGLSGEETPPPTMVIPIDQGEELFNQEGQAENKRFIDILTKTLEADRRVLALLTMRSDFFAQFQTDPVLAALPKDIFTLDRMLEGSYRAVIEGPAALLKPKPLKIDPQLTDALLQDVAGQDALPLLAFTLRYLYDKYQANNELNLEGYEKLGRLKGVIDTAVKQAIADGVAKGELPKDDKAQLALIRMALIPHLVRVNAAGQFVRRVAIWAEIPSETRPLIDRLAEARLLIEDRRAIGGEDVEVIEVAHEALLGEWKDLNNALLEEREFLIAKGELEQDVAEWQATPEERKKGALLAGNKLARARHWLIQRPQDLSADEREFIQASADAEAARRRFLRTVAALAFILISAFAAFAGLEWRKEAKEAARAERNFGAANQLILDITRGLRNVKGVTVESLATVLEGVRATVDELSASAPDDQQILRIRVAMFDESAKTYLAAGDSAAATKSVEESVKIERLILETAENRVDWLRALSVSLATLGDAKLASGDSAGALSAQQESFHIAQGLPASDASSPIEQVLALNNIGKVQLSSGKLDSALEEYNKSLITARQLVKSDESNIYAQRALSLTLSGLGDVLLRRGDLTEALAAYNDSLAISRRLAGTDKSNTEAQRNVSMALIGVGDLMLMQGHIAEALNAYHESLAIVSGLVKIDPGNTQWQQDLANNLERIGRAKFNSGDNNEALAAYEESLAVGRHLAEIDPGNTQWQQDLAKSLEEIGDLKVSSGDSAGALAAYEESLAIDRHLAEIDPTNAKWQQDLARSLEKLGDLKLSSGDSDAALAAYEENYRIVSRLARDAANPRRLQDLARSRGKIDTVIRRKRSN
jgi:tetratricopeptide (TPR) repeat protein